MSDRIKRNIPILKAILSLGAKERKSFLAHSSEDLILSLCELALNILKGNIPLKKSQYTRLKKHKKWIKLFADKKTSVKKKRRVVQTGGAFILPLIAAALPFITSLITGRK